MSSVSMINGHIDKHEEKNPERDRLIELLDGADLFLRNRANAKPAPLNKYDIENLKDIANVCDKAARALEKAIAAPCKPGDTVYAYSDDFFTVLPYFVENLNISYIGKNRLHYAYEANCSKDGELLDSIDFDSDDIGKNVFLSQEEAEAKQEGEIRNG